MAISWTKHRFSGGVLALDTANTVVHRGDAARSFDRFEDPAEIARFASAAAGFRADELGGRPLAVADPEGIASRVLAIRETTDCLFRSAALTGEMEMEIELLPALLAACAAGLDGHSGRIGGPGQPFGDPARPIAFEAALAVSALSLLSGDAVRRLKVCPNCNWLFLDKSRNSSRLWCDMTVCGNRHKAKRHYHRRKAVLEENSYV
jgi:predicted RNA-binding Zn ribbon-like protein